MLIKLCKIRLKDRRRKRARENDLKENRIGDFLENLIRY